jgi:tetraacyldisaccharide 4'-kinase
VSALTDAWLRRGALARLLWPASLLLRAVLWWQARHPVAAIDVGLPVIVVGNLVAGGAGKTPTVRAVVAALRAAGWTPGIVSRGHGRQGDAPLVLHDDTPAAQAGDEPLLLRRATGAPVAVGRDRVAAAQALRAAQPAVDCIVCDDGLQHRRLARTLQVIVFDERGTGNGWLLPAGPLREPLPAALPPRTLVLYNAAAPSTRLPGYLAQRRLGAVQSLADWWRGAPAAAGVPPALRGRRVVAAAGIAHPARFFALLRAAGLDELRELPLPDHHDYATLPWAADAGDVVVTEKDAVKLPPGRATGARVWVATLDFAPDPAFLAALLALMPPKTPPRDGNPTA